MAMKPDDPDVPQFRRLQDWWLNLALSYRVNALLYFLGACFMVFLLTSLLSGGDEPRQIQVGAGVTPSSTTTTTRPAVTAPSSTVAASSSTSSTGPTTTVAGTSGAAGTTSSTRAQTNPTNAPSDTTTVATTTTVANTVGTTPSTTAPTTTTKSCRNSTAPACGQFNWDPGPNSQPINIGVPEVTPSSPAVNAEVTFRITVTDVDHLIGTCAYLDFGDLSSQGSCPEPPCPARYGTWDLPARGGPGAFTFVFTHAYKTAGPFIATFLVDDRSDCWDPYGERRTRSIPVVVG